MRTYFSRKRYVSFWSSKWQRTAGDHDLPCGKATWEGSRRGALGDVNWNTAKQTFTKDRDGRNHVVYKQKQIQIKVTAETMTFEQEITLEG